VKNEDIFSGHGDSKVFEVAEGLSRFLSLTAAAATFLKSHDFLIAREIDIEYACESARVEKVS